MPLCASARPRPPRMAGSKLWPRTGSRQEVKVEATVAVCDRVDQAEAEPGKVGWDESVVEAGAAATVVLAGPRVRPIGGHVQTGKSRAPFMFCRPKPIRRTPRTANPNRFRSKSALV